MIWCLLGPAAALAALGLAALTFDPRGLRLPRHSLGRTLRGCISGSLILLAGLLVALAAAVTPWAP